MFEQRLAAEQNLGLGVAAGMIAAGIGAAVWAAITFFTGYQIGWMAIGVGLLVGYTVSVYGKGLSNLYGIAAALLVVSKSSDLSADERTYFHSSEFWRSGPRQTPGPGIGPSKAGG